MHESRTEWTVALVALLLLSAAGLAGRTPEPSSGVIVPADVAWMLTASALVLLMTPGLAFFYGGMVQRKNVISTMLQSFIAMGLVSLLWITVGFSLAFGSSLHGLIGSPSTYAMFRGVGLGVQPALAPTIPLALFALFQLKFAIITPALVTGALAERVRFSSYLIFVSLFTLFIYCPVAHWTWNPDGFLHRWGVLDFAGGTVVHMTAGFAALAGASFLGRRKTHLLGDLPPASNIPFVMLGAGLLWFGWFGFNAGSALAANASAVRAFMTTNTAAASAMLAWVFFDAARGRRPSAVGASVGAVVGLVAVTPAAGYVTVGQSLFIGSASAIVSNFAAHWRSKTILDDTLDVFPCHGVGGVCGMLFTGLFAEKSGLIHGTSALFLRHLAAVALVGTYSFSVAYLIAMASDALVSLRVHPDQEKEGLDLSQHAEGLA